MKYSAYFYKIWKKDKKWINKCNKINSVNRNNFVAFEKRSAKEKDILQELKNYEKNLII